MENLHDAKSRMQCSQAAGVTNVWPPRVLDTIYRDRVQTLYQLLLHLLTRPSSSGTVITEDMGVELVRTKHGATAGAAAAPKHANKEDRFVPLEKEEAQILLTRQDDPLSYTKLLNKSFAVMPETAPLLGPVTFEQRWTQQQIVERVIELQFRQEAKPSHVLCSGYRKLRPSLIGSSRRRAPVGLECLSGNAAVDMVNSDSWRLLLSRVGDLVMLHILSHAAIFTPLPNDCLLQVSGVAISYSVSVFRKSSQQHTGEKMLRSHFKRNLTLHSTSSAQPEGGGARKVKKQGYFGGPSTFRHAAIVEKSAQACDSTCKSGDDILSSSGKNNCNVFPLKPNSNETKDGKSHLVQTSCARRQGAKRKAQKSIISGDGEPSRVLNFENHSPGRRKRSKVVSHAQIGKAAEICVAGLETDTKAKELVVKERKDHSHHQTSNTRTPMKHKEKFTEAGCRQQSIKGRTNDLIPIATPCNTTRKGSAPTKSAGRDYIQLTESTFSTGKSSLVSENISVTEESFLNLPETSRTKRVRPPSWKRRRMRQQNQEALYQVSPLQAEERPRVSSVEVLKIADKERSHDSFHGLRSVPCGQREPSSNEVAAGNSEGIGIEEEIVPLTEHARFSRNTKQIKDFSRRYAGPSMMLINRASIFYNSNFCRHAGLPANHILNKTKSDDAGVNKLHAVIFGSLESIPVCSSTDPNSFVDTTPTRSIRVLLKKLLSKAKRCAYARLLNRHCPLLQELNSQLVESTPFLTDTTAPLPESQDGLRSSQCVSKKRDIECVEQGGDCHSPEVEEVMKLLLGPLYQPSDSGITKPSTSFGCRHETKGSTDPWIGEHKADAYANKEQFRECKDEKDFSDAIHTANIVTTEKALRAGLIASYTDHNSVVSFLWAACRSIIPPEMLGSKRSWRILRSNIAHFVGLRRHESFNVQQVLSKLKLSGQPWLDAPSTASETGPKPSLDRGERVLQQRRLELWLYWLFTSLLVPLIRCHFYVTEIENHRQNVFYYRKPVWAKLRNIALKDLTQRNYKKLSKKSVAEALVGKALGFSQVRLLPKRTGVRPIANLAAPSQGSLRFRVKSERRPTLRQLFGDFENTSSTCEAVSLKDGHNGSSGIRDKTLGDPSKDFSPQKSGQACVLSRSHIVTSSSYQNLTKANSSVVTDRPSIDSFTDFSPQKSWLSPAGRVTSPTAWCQSSPQGINTGLPGCTRATTPSRDVVPAGGIRTCKVHRKSVTRVNYSFRSVNSVLRDVYFCLKLEKDSYPEDLGSSVFGYSDIHSRILPFILQIKGSGAIPRLYMVVCDVTKAYDTIQQEKLLEIVSAYLRSSDYNVVKYTSVAPTLAAVRVSHGRAPTRACEHQNFSQLVHDLSVKHSHCIFTDQGSGICIRREKILVLLEEHLKHNIVQMGKQFYQQTVGIPQGSTLSSILCSLFYGHFESQRLMPDLQSRLTEKLSLSPNITGYFNSACGLQLPQAENFTTQTRELDVEHMLECSFDICTEDAAAVLGEEPLARSDPHFSCFERKNGDDRNNDIASSVLKNSVLLRLIDDSLFISTSETAAKMFVESMHMGSEEYGCQANKRKTAASFCLKLGKRVLPKKIYTTEDGACFMRWSGLLINCYTLEFQADYTRYAGEHIRSTLTVKREKNQGWHLVLKMCQYMRPKCHALFFDPRINSPATIRLNAYQAFLLCAMKFHAYVCSLPRVTGNNQPFLYEVISCTTRYMYGLLRHRMETVGAKAVEYFPFVELEWLGLVAFHRTLKRKQSRYRMLLLELQAQLETPRYTRMTSCPHLSSATDEKRSSMFKYIKY